MAALTVTVLGGYWEDYGGGAMTLENEDPKKRRIAQLLDQPSNAELKELMLTLNGAAAGSAAAASHSRIKAGETSGSFESDLSGARTIETVTDVGRNTTAADKSNIDSTILAYPLQPTYPANGDGNPRKLAGG